jgi:hypothetical protein
LGNQHHATLLLRSSIDSSRGAGTSRHSHNVPTAVIGEDVDCETHASLRCMSKARRRCVAAVGWSSRPTRRSFSRPLYPRLRKPTFFSLDELAPGARLVQVNQHLPTVMVAHAGYVGCVALQGRKYCRGNSCCSDHAHNADYGELPSSWSVIQLLAVGSFEVRQRGAKSTYALVVGGRATAPFPR